MTTIGWDAVVANGTAGVLGVAAFAVSFTHVRDTAAVAGQGGWVATAIAVSVELMALAAVTEIRRRGRRGQRAAWPWCVLVLGVAMSLSANLATAQDTAWGYVMAGWPAVAFLSVALMVETRAAETDDATRGAAAPVRDAAPVLVPRRHTAADAPRTGEEALDRTGHNVHTAAVPVRADGQSRTDDLPARANHTPRTDTGHVRTTGDALESARTVPPPQTAPAAHTEQDSPSAPADGQIPSPALGPDGENGAMVPHRPTRTEMVAWLVDALRADPTWTPDYPELMARTGYGRSWCEKCVADARHAAWGILTTTALAGPPASTPLT